MRQAGITIKGLGALLLVFAIMLPLFHFAVELTADAAESLPAIKLIKQRGGAFNILEIVPDEATGSVGFLVKGQEPLNDWDRDFAEKRAAEREECAKGIFDRLTTAGLLGSTDETPLRISGAQTQYCEAYPWQDHEGYKKLILSSPETATARGIFTFLSDGVGDYLYTGGYEVASNQKGTANQSIEYFDKYPAEDQNAYFWYDLTFTLVTDTAGLYDSTPVYTLMTEGKQDYYKFSCAAKDMETDTTYYYVSSVEKPKQKQSGRNSYAAISSGYIPAENGYFKESDNSFAYVGENAGQYDFSAGGRDSYTISTFTVYYTTIENNNWFLQNVFDWEQGEASAEVRVNTVAGNSLTQSDISGADLIVICRGFNIINSGDGYQAVTYSDDAANNTDINDSISAALTVAAKTKPVILDSALITGELRINALASTLADNNPAHRVDERLYVAEVPLCREFTSSLSGDGFRLVNTQISENVDKLLNTDVNPASAVRYVIAFAMNEGLSGDVRVLEIQPGKTGEISPAQVQSWLDADVSLNVSIDTMSTYELVGRTDHIAEKYDLVYIGSSVADMNTKEIDGQDISYYSDISMDGLVYTNIGDIVISGGDSGFNLSGLLDRDYNASSAFTADGKTYNSIATGYRNFGDLLEWFKNYNDTTRTFRYSGNDLTATKIYELVDFAQSRPVILANDLITKTEISAAAEAGRCDYQPLLIMYSCDYSIELKPDNKDFALNAFITYGGSSVDGRVSNADIVWHKVVNGVDSVVKTHTNAPVHYGASSADLASTLDLTEEGLGPGEYYCTAEARYVTLLDWGYHQTSNVSAASSQTLTITDEINTDRIDNSSYMYELIEKIKDKHTVVPRWQTDISSVKSALSASVSLQKPQIRFITDGDGKGRPASYTDKEGSLRAEEGNYYLNYQFELTGPGAPFTCSLYIDANGDGRYSETESLTDLVITQSADNARAEAGRLVNSTYKLVAQLPRDALGIIPWKLSIQSNGQTYRRCSVEGFAHVAPGERVKTLNVLQVNSALPEDPGSTSGSLNLETNIQFSDPVSGLFKQVESELKVNMMTVRANELDTLLEDYQQYITDRSKTARGEDSENLIEYLRNRAGDTTDTGFKNLSGFLQSFDMLIIGFGDTYRGITANSAAAIVDFINTGKAALFSHDCTSFYFLPREDYHTENWREDWFAGYVDRKLPNYVYSINQYAPNFTMFGYDFNMTIRDGVALDRYGVSNKIYGGTKFSGGAASSGPVAASAYLMADKALLGQLSEANYSIAYKPKSARERTVAETQGLASGLLARFYVSGGRPTKGTYTSGTEEASQITQLNKGRITTYPFNLNTANFGGTAGTNGRIDISATHEQYHQLNLNSGDVVVWYCLAGGEFDYIPNDAVNAYYIYSYKNVTYTGFGHTLKPNGDVNENEAKLLVNTIIAAYRSFDAEISFTDFTGKKALTDFLLPSDDGELLTTGLSTDDPTRRIYFTVKGTGGLDSTATAQASLDWAVNGTAKRVFITDIYNANGKPATSLVNGEVYFLKLGDVISTININSIIIGAEGLELSIGINTGQNAEAIGTATLILRKLSLLNLC